MDGLNPSQNNHNDILINGQLLRFGGAMGRRAYIINSMIVLILPLFIYLISNLSALSAMGLSLNTPQSALGIFFGFGIILILPVIGYLLLVISITSRRIRDIRGKSDDHWLWVAGYFILGFIPLVNIALWLLLASIPGKISNPEGAADLIQNFTSFLPESKTQHADVIQKIKHLDEMRRSGAINETEFQKLKSDLITKSTG